MDDSRLKLINTFSSSDRLDRTDQRLHAHEEQKEKAKPRYADNFFRVVACVKAIVCGKAFSGGGEWINQPRWHSSLKRKMPLKVWLKVKAFSHHRQNGFVFGASQLAIAVASSAPVAHYCPKVSWLTPPSSRQPGLRRGFGASITFLPCIDSFIDELIWLASPGWIQLIVSPFAKQGLVHSSSRLAHLRVASAMDFGTGGLRIESLCLQLTYLQLYCPQLR